MLRKSIMFFVVLAFSVSVDAFAVSSVRKLGATSVSSGATKTVSTLPKAPASVPSGESLQTKSVVTPATREIGDANARLSAGVNSIKTISSGKITSAISEAGQLATMGAIDSAVERIGDLEGEVDALDVRMNDLEDSAVKGLSESGNGNYVSNVSLGEDNEITVTKTNVIVAPVRTGSYSGAEGEIWLVK